MGYARGYPVRLAGGRLALDFVNTADWSADDRVIHEKIETLEDVRVWLEALGLGSVRITGDIAELQSFRSAIRGLFRGGGTCDSLHAAAGLEFAAGRAPAAAASDQPLPALIAVSALSVLLDPRERARLKMCPGKECGWLFIDETKNARRRWCVMETCGNRAKAARHYARRIADGDAEAGG